MLLAQYTEEITNPALGTRLKEILAGERPGETFLGLFLRNIITLLLIVAAIVTLFLLIVGGIQWMTAGGDKAATESARGRITAAIIGLIIVFAVFAIMKLLSYLLGIDLLTIEIGRLMLK